MTMSNDPFLDGLVTDLQPVRRRDPRLEGLAFAGLCALELALWLASGNVRPGLMHALTIPTFWWKFVTAGLLAVLGATATIASLEPTRSPRPGLIAIAAAAGVFVAVGVRLASQVGLANLWARLDWTDGVDCVVKIVLLSAPPMAGLAFLVRRGAPTDLAGVSLAASVAAAAWAAFVFLFCCPHDDPVYILAWYPLACGLSTLLARTALLRIGRW
jgi:hypothetical protein